MPGQNECHNACMHTPLPMHTLHMFSASSMYSYGVRCMGVKQERHFHNMDRQSLSHTGSSYACQPIRQPRSQYTRLVGGESINHGV